MTSKAVQALAGVAAIASIALPSQAAAGQPAETSAEPLISFSGPSKLKIGKRLTYSFVCSVNCDVSLTNALKGPKTKLSDSFDGSLAAGVQAGIVLKPNGTLLKNLKADPGKFSLKVAVSAVDPTTGETDTDKRTFKFKR